MQLGAASDLVGIAGKSQAIDVNFQDRAYEGGRGRSADVEAAVATLQRTVYDSTPGKQVMLTTTATPERDRLRLLHRLGGRWSKCARLDGGHDAAMYRTLREASDGVYAWPS
ncbi:hypothetical protein NHJ13734_005601 [Beauveria thailandica]